MPVAWSEISRVNDAETFSVSIEIHREFPHLLPQEFRTVSGSSELHRTIARACLAGEGPGVHKGSGQAEG